jgi:aryl-alcohol dehydrogenase-like predicted oxidoreductase
VSEDDAMAVLHAAVDAGVTFLDTADVYGDGRSEQLVGRLRAERGDLPLVVATKAGRRADPHVPEAFTAEALGAWTDRSRKNLQMDTLDLVQLHCPPTPVYDDDRVFDALDRLVEKERVRAYGVSVETVDEALRAIARPGVASVQIILNVFRRKPLERVLPAAAEAGVAVIARVPLASGLLSGKYDESTTFAADDHRTYNRDGSAFDVGETFSGVPFDVGVRAAREVAAHTPEGATTAQLALRWVLDQPGVTSVIPGARSAEQARGNAGAAALPPLAPEVADALREVYDREVRPHVHDRW